MNGMNVFLIEAAYVRRRSLDPDSRLHFQA